MIYPVLNKFLSSAFDNQTKKLLVKNQEQVTKILALLFIFSAKSRRGNEVANVLF